MSHLCPSEAKLVLIKGTLDQAAKKKLVFL